MSEIDESSAVFPKSRRVTEFGRRWFLIARHYVYVECSSPQFWARLVLTLAQAACLLYPMWKLGWKTTLFSLGGYGAIYSYKIWRDGRSHVPYVERNHAARSLALYSLMSQLRGHPGMVGVVSIDSSRGYHFDLDKRELVDHLAPYVRMLGWTIAERCPTVSHTTGAGGAP